MCFNSFLNNHLKILKTLLKNLKKKNNMVVFYNVYTINCHIFEDLKQLSRPARHIKFARHKSTLVAHQAYVSAGVVALAFECAHKYDTARAFLVHLNGEWMIICALMTCAYFTQVCRPNGRVLIPPRAASSSAAAMNVYTECTQCSARVHANARRAFCLSS